MNDEIRARAKSWLDSNIDQETRNEIERMLAEDGNELAEAFYKELEFGTGGLRGIMGAGSNRMNRFTVGKATQGLSNYLRKSFPGKDLSVAIAYDSRINSEYFARITAQVFAANGIKVFFFDGLRPTPELSYAIRELGCDSGVVLTASHNPKEYNGYKAYWNDGAQLVPPHDKAVIDEVNTIESLDDIKFEGNPELIQTIGEDMDARYLDKIMSLSFSDGLDKDIKIVFSPIHGTGITLVPRILEEIGFSNVHVVPEQSEPDGNFPTVVYPNPEEKEAMTLALKMGEDIGADLIMATDPDSDRVGIAVKNSDGDYQLLNGNQTACILFYYVLMRNSEAGRITGKEYIVSTIVTTELLEKIASAFNVEYYSTLTGFKWIAELIRDLEGEKSFLVGGEESYGYMVSDFVRDKDAVASCAMIAEMTAYAKNQGKTLFELLLDIYSSYGFYLESMKAMTRKGIEGAKEIEKMMKDLREDPPSEINGSAVIRSIDYQNGTETDHKTGAKTKIDYPASNVLQFYTEDGSKISARPSGTEPKIKFYISVHTDLVDKSEYTSKLGELNNKIESISKDLKL